jgi:hypothetical protein
VLNCEITPTIDHYEAIEIISETLVFGFDKPFATGAHGHTAILIACPF